MEFEVKLNDSSSCCFEQYLYNTPLHLSFQPSQNLYYLSLINRQSGMCHARVHFFMEGEKALSSFKAPFGSLEYATDLSDEELFSFIKAFESSCKQYGAKIIEIDAYPFCYNSQQSQQLFNNFIKAGYQVKSIELNFHIDVAENKFSENLHVSAKRRLKKCLQKGYTFQKESKERLKDFYDLYTVSRKYTGIPMNMSLVQLEKYFDTFPDQYHIFTVKDGANIIAATICINNSSEILYNFLPCDDPAYRTNSPMVYLMKGIYDYCLSSGIKTFDQGIASVNGVPQASLMKFKKHLGAKLSAKPKFKKDLF